MPHDAALLTLELPDRLEAAGSARKALTALNGSLHLVSEARAARRPADRQRARRQRASPRRAAGRRPWFEIDRPQREDPLRVD
jgi:hypothetical protein